MLRIPAIREMLVAAVIGLTMASCDRPPSAVATAAGDGADAVSLAGAWQMEFRSASGPTTWVADCVMEQEARQISGGCTSGFDSLASLNGRLVQDASPPRVTFDLVPKRTADDAATFSAFTVASEINDAHTQLSGTWRSEDGHGGVLTGGFAATRR